MNRYRLNQILEILVYPVTDSEMARKDPLLLCYQAYRDFMRADSRRFSGALEREEKDARYQERRRDLIDNMVKHGHEKAKSKDDIRMLCDYFFSMSKIENEMMMVEKIQAQRKLKFLEMENINYYYLTSLARISRSLITYRDGVASIKHWIDGGEGKAEADIFGSSSVFNKLEIWNLLCRITVPDIYIAIAAVENRVGMKALYEQKTNIALADKLLENQISRGVAENHLHFNVGFDYSVMWIPYMNLDFAEESGTGRWNRDKYARLEAAVFRYVAADYFMTKKRGEGFRNWITKELPAGMAKVLLNMYSGVYIDMPNREFGAEIHSLRKRQESRGEVKSYDYLLNEVYREYIEYKTSSELILLYQSYQYVKGNCWDTFFARMLVQYLRLKNEYFSTSLQTHVMQGLNYFQESYNAAKRHASTALSERELMVEIFRSQSRVSHLKKLEIRIAPRVKGIALDLLHYSKCKRSIQCQLYDQIYQVLSAYRQYILESTIGVLATWKLLGGERGGIRRKLQDDILQGVSGSRANIPTLGVVFHFLKSEHLEDCSGNYCWRRILNGEEHYTVYRMLKRMYVENIARALEEIREAIPGLNEYIVGIDAASDENAMEPWMFSPAYKVIRSHKFIKPVMEAESGGERFKRIQNIGFTYHVGEDFRHVISGLRHVDEVLEEFSYKAGDRLGHALVLGIDMDQWINGNEVVFVPVLEHLENLLWMWGTNTCQGLALPIQLEVLEDKIIDIAEEIYDFPETISVKMLYTAYKKKFIVNHGEIVKKLLDTDEYSGCYCDGKRCYGKWTAELLLSTHYCPVYEKKYEKVKLVSVSAEEAAVYKTLQKYLIQKVEQRGVYIETNPTSNLTIGDFSHMYRHPIFQLNSVDKNVGNHAFVTINSDDPAVFNTNVENDLAYIYYAAQAQGIAKSKVIEWVEQIRQYGMEASFIKKEKNAVQMLTELEEIMREITRIDI